MAEIEMFTTNEKTVTTMSDTSGPVIHYADADRDGVSFIDEHTLAPIPPLCDGGKEGDLMSFFWHETTCPACKNASTDV